MHRTSPPPSLSSFLICCRRVSIGVEKDAIPSQTVHTIATMAVLVGPKNISDSLIEASLKFIYESDLNFKLPVLLNKQQAYEWSLYPKHPTATAYFNPYEGVDLLAAFMESMAAAKELMFAFIAGLYLFWNWIQQRKKRLLSSVLARQKEHLDAYLSKTIEIEHMQLDEQSRVKLKEYLNEVTSIKLDVLKEFTHEDLRADSSFQIFIDQCANLILEIQNKLLLLENQKQANKVE